MGSYGAMVDCRVDRLDDGIYGRASRWIMGLLVGMIGFTRVNRRLCA